MNTCQHGGDNHSSDLIQIYTGGYAPVLLCGYHASQFLIREAQLH
jgi:hypothetical protein